MSNYHLKVSKIDRSHTHDISHILCKQPFELNEYYSSQVNSQIVLQKSINVSYVKLPFEGCQKIDRSHLLICTVHLKNGIVCAIVQIHATIHK